MKSITFFGVADGFQYETKGAIRPQPDWAPIAFDTTLLPMPERGQLVVIDRIACADNRKLDMRESSAPAGLAGRSLVHSGPTADWLVWIAVYRRSKTFGGDRGGSYYGAGLWLRNAVGVATTQLAVLAVYADRLAEAALHNGAFIRPLPDAVPLIDLNMPPHIRLDEIALPFDHNVQSLLEQRTVVVLLEPNSGAGNGTVGLVDLCQRALLAPLCRRVILTEDRTVFEVAQTRSNMRAVSYQEFLDDIILAPLHAAHDRLRVIAALTHQVEGYKERNDALVLARDSAERAATALRQDLTNATERHTELDASQKKLQQALTLAQTQMSEKQAEVILLQQRLEDTEKRGGLPQRFVDSVTGDLANLSRRAANDADQLSRIERSVCKLVDIERSKGTSETHQLTAVSKSLDDFTLQVTQLLSASRPSDDQVRAIDNGALAAEIARVRSTAHLQHEGQADASPAPDVSQPRVGFFGRCLRILFLPSASAHVDNKGSVESANHHTEKHHQKRKHK